MKILKLLNKKNLAILLSICLFQNVFSEEAADIWNLENNNVIENSEEIENENLLPSSVFTIESQDTTDSLIKEEENLLSRDLDIVGIYDPSDNDLSINMWKNTNGLKILEIINKIDKMNLSEEAINILNVALLTNSYFPQRNMSRENFLKIKSDWLIKQQNLKLIETYLEKNKNVENISELTKYYINYYLSKSDLNKACEIFEDKKIILKNDYIEKFKIYCLINLNKIEEAQLQFDLLKETDFKDDFFERKYAYLMGYETKNEDTISEKSLLDFHLSHKTSSDFKFEPKLNTSKLIWKYLSSANLLESVDYVDLENIDKIYTIEKATHEKNYEEKELFALYERFLFNINQLLTVKETYKLLPSTQSRALLYQGILLTKGTPEKIELIKILKNSFQNDNITNAFDSSLKIFLKEIDASEVPSNYVEFYQAYLKNENPNKKIKYNNKILHQSKILNYFKEGSDPKNIEKDLENLLKKIKKDKKYFFSLKDIILLESLKSDGVKISKKYENIYDYVDPGIPYDIQILINKQEIGLALLRLVEIIGEDNIEDIGSETVYFIISILNQLDIDKLRNKILLKVLPLKV